MRSYAFLLEVCDTKRFIAPALGLIAWLQWTLIYHLVCRMKLLLLLIIDIQFSSHNKKISAWNILDLETQSLNISKFQEIHKWSNPFSLKQQVYDLQFHWERNPSKVFPLRYFICQRYFLKIKQPRKLE